MLRTEKPAMKTVLLADDSQIMLRLTRSQFKIFGDRVALHTVTCGRSALEAWERLAPDLTILDISMPYLDGTERGLIRMVGKLLDLPFHEAA